MSGCLCFISSIGVCTLHILMARSTIDPTSIFIAVCSHMQWAFCCTVAPYFPLVNGASPRRIAEETEERLVVQRILIDILVSN